MFKKKETIGAVDIDTTYTIGTVKITLSKRKSDEPLFRIYPKRKIRVNAERFNGVLILQK